MATLLIQITGVVSTEESAMMVDTIDAENAERTAYNTTVPPPLTPKPLLPKGNPAQINSSMAEILNTKAFSHVWESYITQRKQREGNKPAVKTHMDNYINATTAKRAASDAALA